MSYTQVINNILKTLSILRTYPATIILGHALLADREERMLELAERYSDRVYSIHAQDNYGVVDEIRKQAKTLEDYCRISGEGDIHKIPFEGIFRWREFAEILAHSAYQLPVVLETVCREESESDFLIKNVNAGIHLTQMIEECKHQ